MPRDTTQQTPQNETRTGLSLIDCDLHQRWASPEELTSYLPDRYRDRGIVVPTLLYGNPGGFFREDAIPDDGTKPGATLENVTEHLLDAIEPDYVMLTGHSGLHLSALPNRDYAAELARAYNRWLIDTWLTLGGPFIGSMYVAPQDPERAAEQIREFGSHPRIKQVLIPSAGQLPYGQPFYWPIYEAAEELGLPVAVHPFNDGHGTNRPPTGAGHPSTYFEWHTLLGTYYMGQLASLITEGVFEQFPDLRFVFVEGGFGWLPHFMWRMDKNWKALRSQTPWLERPPSEYIREHVRFTTQPMEEPPDPEQMRHLLEMMYADEVLMFASDYPHWDGDDPTHGFPPLPEESRRRIFHETARELYDLPADPSDLPAEP